MNSEEFLSFVTTRIQNDKGLEELRAHVGAVLDLQMSDWRRA